jgi:hypothetical protein
VSHLNNVPSDCASFVWLATMSPQRRQQLDERIKLATAEAMREDAKAAVTIKIEILPNLEQERADLGTTVNVSLPAISGAGAPVSVFAQTGDIAAFGEKVSGRKGKLASVHNIDSDK